jgi:dienelactone hydrolase
MKAIGSKAAMTLMGLLAGMMQGKIHTETVTYRAGEMSMQGYLAYDDSPSGKRPGVLVVPEWWGLAEHPEHSAQRLAKLVIFIWASKNAFNIFFHNGLQLDFCFHGPQVVGSTPTAARFLFAI